MGRCQPECASCGSNSARGDAAPYLPHSGDLMVGHPLLDRFLKSGRDEARLEVLGAAFHPLALVRLGAVFIPETQAWKNERRRHAPPPPRLSFLAAGDCGAIEPWSPPLLSSQSCPFWGRRAELRLWRQGTHSWAAPPAAYDEPTKPSIHSNLRFPLFPLVLFTLVLPLPGPSMAVQSPDSFTGEFLSLDQAGISLKTKEPTDSGA